MQNEINILRDFYLVYDYIYTGDMLPNALNHKYSISLFKNHGFVDESVISEYRNNYIQLPNLNAYLDVHYRLINRITFNEYKTSDLVNKEAAFCYPIEPYANINHVLGTPHTLDKRAVISNIPTQTLEELQNPDNNFYLLIAFTNEGTIKPELFEYLYNICYDYNIPNKKLIFSIACPDVELHHQKYVIKEKIPQDSQIKTFYWHWSLRQKADEATIIINDDYLINQDASKSKPSIVQETNIDSSIIRNNKFMMFNRRPRDHRVSLIALLGNEFVENNLVSYDMDMNDNDTSSEFFKSRLPSGLIDLAVNNLEEIYVKNKKSIIDFDDIDTILGFGYEKSAPYLDSYIHICTETNFYEPGIYFSEKTWKPILNLQPFINVNYPGALKHLKEMGFETFHPFINEGYDSILDPKKRMEFIYNEIVRLNSLSIEEIHEWYHSILGILVYNQNHALQHAKEMPYQIKLEEQYLKKIRDYVRNS